MNFCRGSGSSLRLEVLLRCSFRMKYLLAGARGQCPAHILLWGRQEMLWQDKTEQRRGNRKWRGEGVRYILFGSTVWYKTSSNPSIHFFFYNFRYILQPQSKLAQSDIELISKWSNKICHIKPGSLQETFGKLINFNSCMSSVMCKGRYVCLCLNPKLCKSHQFICLLFLASFSK